jgi:death-on-curing protein
MTLFVTHGLFVALNGWRLETTQLDAIETMVSLATGTLDESDLANWIRQRIRLAK